MYTELIWQEDLSAYPKPIETMKQKRLFFSNGKEMFLEGLSILYRERTTDKYQPAISISISGSLQVISIQVYQLKRKRN
jgi:hypothetical protein